MVPDFILKAVATDVFDAKGNRKSKVSIALPTPFSQYTETQMGSWEIKHGFKAWALCQKCERRFGVLESYTRETLYGRAPGPKIAKLVLGRSLGLPIAEFGLSDQYTDLRKVNVDYSKFKLFQMSILWRASMGLYAQTLENSVRQFAITFLGLIGSNP
jgi:hypothetical protein